ncbi:cation diffusion facilitator family transporter [Bifidobacterium sp. ESL0732]|uniref:cation diffusion facilitator family transporter n=1 Tax=Bifidobacterium sp. ESL0732 TaxID=2983222 RepID=UPI0023F7F36A|nr:cation diffusion facilitator family transporter [Bifidobacterium sp. ESL0732]WEV64830.1 cation diffusion facilitator family transporter [Bifidobacterium sp. ESL0732]
MASDSVKTALLANVGVAVAKGLAAAFTGSSAMMSEAVHSVADCANELVLMVGGKAAAKSDKDHPFGLYRAKYLASFLVATLLFFVGGWFSSSQSFEKLVKLTNGSMPRGVESIELLASLAVIVVSACLEGFGLHTSIREAHERMETLKVSNLNLFAFWRKTKSAELASVMMEDTLALVGLVFAGLGIAMALVTGDEIWDAVGGMCVGVILIVGAVALGFKSGSLLIGEAVEPEMVARIRKAVEETPGVDRLINMQAMHMAEDDILLCLKVQTTKLDHDYDVETINKIESAVRKALPFYRFEIYVEPDLYRKPEEIKQSIMP